MHGLEMTLNIKVSMLMIALLINWEFVVTLAHLNKDDAKFRANESLKIAPQSPADLERLYLRTADLHEDGCELYNASTPSNETREDSVTESTFKCHACLSDHSWDNKWGNADSNQNGPIPTPNDEFEELPSGPVTWRALKSKFSCSILST